MRIRIIKPLSSGHGFPMGAVITVPSELGKRWCQEGIAMQDKSLDGAKEVKDDCKTHTA